MGNNQRGFGITSLEALKACLGLRGAHKDYECSLCLPIHLTERLLRGGKTSSPTEESQGTQHLGRRAGASLPRHALASVRLLRQQGSSIQSSSVPSPSQLSALPVRVTLSAHWVPSAIPGEPDLWCSRRCQAPPHRPEGLLPQQADRGSPFSGKCCGWAVAGTYLLASMG